jgi:hypothetical protein
MGERHTHATLWRVEDYQRSNQVLVLDTRRRGQSLLSAAQPWTPTLKKFMGITLTAARPKQLNYRRKRWGAFHLPCTRWNFVSKA